MTKYLNFSEDFTAKILSGEKQATLRLGVKDYAPGEVVIVRAGTAELGSAEIVRVRQLRFCELTDEDARLDGFPDLQALRDALERFYGKFEDSQIFTQIVFRMVR
ncbi:MAG: ASCH domain-containing protein [Euryarchaeota archaeon]|nr:ASCH domain-containing protein [Euryarchaeota archaeon]